MINDGRAIRDFKGKLKSNQDYLKYDDLKQDDLNHDDLKQDDLKHDDLKHDIREKGIKTGGKFCTLFPRKE